MRGDIGNEHYVLSCKEGKRFYSEAGQVLPKSLSKARVLVKGGKLSLKRKRVRC